LFVVLTLDEISQFLATAFLLQRKWPLEMRMVGPVAVRVVVEKIKTVALTGNQIQIMQFVA
jgi:hypothetical protein